MFSVYSIAGTVAKKNLRGVELTRFALFYCFLVREKLGLQVYMFSVYSIAGTVATK